MHSSTLSWTKPPSRRRGVLLVAFLLGAPLALLLSFHLHHWAGHKAEFRISIDRQLIISAARVTAARLKLDASTWTAEVKTHINSDAVECFRRHRVPQSEPSRRFAGELGGEVLLLNPARDAGLQVTIGADGTELGYRLYGSMLNPAEPIGEEEMLALAVIETRAAFGDLVRQGLGTPEISMVETEGAPGVRRVTFRPLTPDSPDLQFTVNLDFLGGRIIAREVLAEPSEPFVERVLRESRTFATYGNIFRVLLLIGFSLYAAFRFSRRIADGEAPILRAVLLTAVMPLFGAALFLLDPALSAPAMKPAAFTAVGLLTAFLSRLFGYFIQGIVMGMGYGGGESFMREAFPGKLISLDAALKGRLLSSNVGQAVLTGLAAGCWMVLFYHLLLPLAGNPISSAVLVNTAIGLTPHPWFIYFQKSLLIALFASSVCLLVPVLVYGKLAGRPKALAAALFVTALAIGAVDESHAPDSPDFWLRSLLMAATLTATFFLWDFLAALAAMTTVGVLAPLADMIDRMPAWQNVLPVASGLAAVTLLPMLYAAFRGRLYTERELLPRYARVQAERLALQAELSAAREAQLRLLPTSLPSLPGVSMAASCIPAREVAGDFYDFVGLEGGGLGVIVAEGGNDGLASALTIALAKGFLMFEGEACRDVHRTIEQLERVLGENLQRTSGRTAIALLAIDPVERRVSIARVGAFPRVVALSASGEARDANLLEDASDGVACGSLTLAPGDSILIFTDGLARLASLRNQGEIEQLLRRAAAFTGATSATAVHDTILSALLPRDRKPPADMADDITAVVISFSAQAARGRQEVA